MFKCTGREKTRCSSVQEGKRPDVQVYRKGQDQMFKCTDCDKTFTSSVGLQQHGQHHTGYYAYFCATCRKGFTVSTNFNEHVRSREGRGYSCDYCGKIFKCPKNLRYHTPLHTGIYRFACDVCGRGFNVHVKPDFIKHKYTHG